MKEYFTVMRVFFIVIIGNAVYNTEVSILFAWKKEWKEDCYHIHIFYQSFYSNYFRHLSVIGKSKFPGSSKIKGFGTKWQNREPEMWKKTFVLGRIPENEEEILKIWKENFFKRMISFDKWMKILTLWIILGLPDSLFF